MEEVLHLVELTGTSTHCLEEAMHNAMNKAAKSVRTMRWFRVIETQRAPENGEVAVWQVTLKIGFAVD
jgi:dodecin